MNVIVCTLFITNKFMRRFTQKTRIIKCNKGRKNKFLDSPYIEENGKFYQYRANCVNKERNLLMCIKCTAFTKEISEVIISRLS